MTVPGFAELAARPEVAVEDLALALAAEFREVDAQAVRAALDGLAAEVAAEPRGDAAAQVAALAAVLGGRHGFAGRREGYDDPDNSMIDLVVERRRGLPIVLSVVYVAVARRAGIELAGVGLAGHFVAAHLGADPPLVLDPFAGGRLIEPGEPVRPWGAHATALRMLNNLAASYAVRGDIARAIHAARLRLTLPVPAELRAGLRVELRALQARLN